MDFLVFTEDYLLQLKAENLDIQWFSVTKTKLYLFWHNKHVDDDKTCTMQSRWVHLPLEIIECVINVQSPKSPLQIIHLNHSGIIGIWFNQATTPDKNVLFDVYWVSWCNEYYTLVKMLLNHCHVLRYLYIAIRKATDWLVLCSFLMQCK